MSTLRDSCVGNIFQQPGNKSHTMMMIFGGSWLPLLYSAQAASSVAPSPFGAPLLQAAIAAVDSAAALLCAAQ